MHMCQPPARHGKVWFGNDLHGAYDGHMYRGEEVPILLQVTDQKHMAEHQEKIEALPPSPHIRCWLLLYKGGAAKKDRRFKGWNQKTLDETRVNEYQVLKVWELQGASEWVQLPDIPIPPDVRR